MPDKSFVVLEMQESYGGTWWTHSIDPPTHAASHAGRAHAELGMVAAKGKAGVKDLVAIVTGTQLPGPMKQAFQALVK